MTPFLPYILCYLVGAIPFSVFIGNVFFKVDIRNQGSGNPGATNALRTLGAKAGIIVLVLDMAKGFLPVLLAPYLIKTNGLDALDVQALAALSTTIGHTFSIFLKFKGGKGVATAFGAILAYQPWYGLAMVLVFVAIVYLTKYVSFGSIIAMMVYMGLNFFFYFYTPIVLGVAVFIATLITLKHKANIQRLMKGAESKLSFKKTG
ncbi:MAG: glycerol-3-phosphate 1-O-acyltransferase PlsY [Bacteroidetes bacterium]|nr:glycerol-3-phosphate 1-O-acyltransferase PlsY [Bacteroidota bacterium]